MADNTGWATNKDPWGLVSDEITNGSWKKFKANRNSANLIPSKPGIYMFCASQALDTIILQTPLYIGKATNLKRRFKDHIRVGIKIQKLKKTFGTKLEFCFLQLENDILDEDLRLHEQSMIDCFGPQFNEIDSVAVLSPLRGKLGKRKQF